MTRGTPHPNLGGVLCEIAKPNHPECTGWSQLGQDFVDWLNPDYEPPKRTTKAAARTQLKVAAGRVEPAPAVGTLEGFEAGVEGSQRAATRWTEQEVALVDAAIRAVAVEHSGGREFTSDAIWEKLAGSVPVTKGLTARLMVASRAGLIDTTGKFAISERGGHHDHGQRLSVWYSLVP